MRRLSRQLQSFALLGSLEASRTYVQRTLLDDPATIISYWPIDERSGTTIYDRRSNRNGTATNLTLGVAGQEGWPETAGRLAATGYINVASAGLASAFNAAAGTVEVLVKPTGGTNGGAWQEVTARRAVLLQADTSNRVILELSSSNQSIINLTYVAGGTTKTISVTNVPALYGGWLSLVLTWDKAADQVKAYLNGAQVGSTLTGLGTWAGAISVALIGAGNTVPSQPWKGDIQHVILRNVAKTPTQVAAAYRVLTRLVVLEGDSRTVGTGASVWVNYPSQLSWQTTESSKFANIATSGEKVSQMVTQVATQVAPLYSTGYARNLAVLWGGVNDGATDDAATIYARIVAWHTAVRALGFKTVACTEIDCQDAARNANNWHTVVYPALNTLIRANWATFADALADLGGDGRLQNALDTTYFAADACHLVQAGYAAVAGLVRAAIQGV